VMRAFQDEGHTAVVIIGDYTAMIGDPSGRSETRPMLTREQVDANARTYFAQIYKVLDPDRTEVHGNAEWLAEMTAADVLRLMASATLQQVLQREDFANRLREGEPIGAHEILYPFSQAYDSVATRADLEVGGTDQLFNLLFGREVQRAYAQEPQDIAVFPLLEGLDGVQKMSKSLGNYIGVDEPPEQIYGKIMSIPDPLVGKYLYLISGLTRAEILRISDLDNLDRKAALARRMVERLHSAEAAAWAEEDFNRRVRRREVPRPEDVPPFATSYPTHLVDVLVNSGLAKSRNEARRLINQRGVRVNGDTAAEQIRLKPGDIVQVGSRRAIRLDVSYFPRKN